jgi:hypothetical protein
MRLFLTPLILMGLVACSESGTAAEAADQQKQGAFRPFDIAGVKLGDDLATAKAALEARGFAVQIDRAGWSYEDRIGKAVADAEGKYFDSKVKGVRSVWATKGGERVDAQIQETNPGGRVTQITYSTPSAGRSKDQLIAEVQSRYGRTLDDVGRTSVFTICASGEPACQQRVRKLNYVSVTISEPTTISLFPGSDLTTAWRAEFDAAVAAKVGAKASSY